MRILLLRPDPGNERFGLGPFFRVEPLGLEYIGAALRNCGHEPRLGAKRFFELYAETWRRSILNASGEKKWLDWMRQVRLSAIPYLASVLWRTQKMMKPEAYLREYEMTKVVPGDRYAGLPPHPEAGRADGRAVACSSGDQPRETAWKG